MRPDAHVLRAILQDFTRSEGRSAYAEIVTPEWSWRGGAREDRLRPAASLPKVAIGMALEPRLASLKAQRVGDLVHVDDVSILHALHPDHVLLPLELHALMLSASDAPATRWAVDQVGLEAVHVVIRSTGASLTQVSEDSEFGVRGVTTARDAVALVRAADDAARFPACARALRHSIANSRIPLGVTAADIAIAHKTGTLDGVAHDVAHLGCDRGDLWIAYLSEDEDDTLVTGYDMGVCTRALLDYAGLQVLESRSFDARP